MIVLGLLLGTIGRDVTSGTARFTMGFQELYGGINFVSLAVGMFGVSGAPTVSGRRMLGRTRRWWSRPKCMRGPRDWPKPRSLLLS
jgi:TctA family transporter